MSKQVEVIEVGPRDGFQSVKCAPITTEQKLTVIDQRQVEPLEQVIDKLKDELRTNHIARLQRGECSLAAGFVLSDLLTNLERVSDHCSNIAGCLLDMKNERIDLHKYLGDVKSGSNEFLLQYNAFEEKYKLEA